MKSKTYLLIIITCACILGNILPMKGNDYTKMNREEALIFLDNAIDSFNIYRQEKVNRLYEYKRCLKTARTDEDNFLWVRQIYMEYLGNDADSAMAYINKAADLAQRLNQQNKIISVALHKASLLGTMGLLSDAYSIINNIDVKSLPPLIKSEYYEQRLKVAFNQELFLRVGTDYNRLGDKLYDEMMQIRDSLINYTSPNVAYAMINTAWLATDSSSTLDKKAIINELTNRIRRSKLNDINVSGESYALSRLLLVIGNKTEYLKYAALSVAAIVRGGNLYHDNTAIEELSQELLTLGEVERAYKYINFAYRNAVDYHARARVVYLGRIQDSISKQYIVYNQDIANRKSIFFVLICILAVIMVASVVYMILQTINLRKNKEKLQSSFNEINTMHQSLMKASKAQKLLNEKLHHTNALLSESDKIKEQYLGYAFSVCSQYISKLESFRKAIYKCAKDNDTKELRKLVALPILEQAELKEFYTGFDQVFLTIYPNFVVELNKLLKDEEQLNLKENNTMNTELRVFALMRLGITEIDVIASFLHCSVQTVYNSRQRMYLRTSMLKNEFKKSVANLCRPQITNNED